MFKKRRTQEGNLNEKGKTKQWLMVVGGLSLLLLVVMMCYPVLKSKPTVSTTSAQTDRSLSAPTTEGSVKEGLSAELNRQKGQIVDLNKVIHQLQSSQKQNKDELAKQLNNQFKTLLTSQAEENPSNPTATDGINTPFMGRPLEMGIQVYHRSKPAPKTPLSAHVTAGTSAVALVLSGAATDAGANGQGNTIPIRLKIETNGRLPNGYHSSLKGCFLTASSYGNVSSERGEIRLSRISCIRGGQVIEKVVEGTVVDRSGMNGISGNTVMRNAPLLWNAGISGFLSGLGSGLSDTFTTRSISALGSTQAVSTGNIFKYGAAKGGETALGKLSDYYIKMADLYHPVVELHPGQYVGIFFLKGFTLEKKVKKPMVPNSDTSNSVETIRQDGFQSMSPELSTQIADLKAQTNNAINLSSQIAGGIKQ